MEEELELEEISEEDKKITLEDENGEVKEYDIIANVNTEDGSFIVYTDNRVLDNGQVALYINSLIKENGEVTFGKVDDDELDAILNEIKERLQ